MISIPFQPRPLVQSRRLSPFPPEKRGKMKPGILRSPVATAGVIGPSFRFFLAFQKRNFNSRENVSFPSNRLLFLSFLRSDCKHTLAHTNQNWAWGPGLALGLATAQRQQGRSRGKKPLCVAFLERTVYMIVEYNTFFNVKVLTFISAHFPLFADVSAGVEKLAMMTTFGPGAMGAFLQLYQDTP